MECDPAPRDTAGADAVFFCQKDVLEVADALEPILGDKISGYLHVNPMALEVAGIFIIGTLAVLILSRLGIVHGWGDGGGWGDDGCGDGGGDGGGD